MLQQPDLAALAKAIRGGAPAAPPPGMNLADLAKQIRGEKVATSGGPSPHDALIDKYAAQFGVPQDLVRSMIVQESSGEAGAVGRETSGGRGRARGLMQLMPATAKQYGVTDPFDPEQNIRAGVQHLAWLRQRYPGDDAKVIAAYNAGHVPVDKAGGVPNWPETQNYVEKVQSGRGAFQPPDPASTPGQPVPSTPEAAPRQSVVEAPKDDWTGAIKTALPVMARDLMQTLPFKVGQPAVDVAQGAVTTGKGIVDAATLYPRAMTGQLRPDDPAKAINAIVEGGLEMGSPLILPAMVAAPYFTPAMVGTAMFAQRKAVAYAKAQGWPEEYQRLAGNLATLVTLGVASPRVLKGFGKLAEVGKDAGAGAVKAIGETGRASALAMKLNTTARPQYGPGNVTPGYSVEMVDPMARITPRDTASETAPLIRERQILDAPAGEAVIRPEVPLPPRAVAPPAAAPAAPPSAPAVLPQPQTLPAEIVVPRPAERAIPPTVAEGQWPPVKAEPAAVEPAAVEPVSPAEAADRQDEKYFADFKKALADDKAAADALVEQTKGASGVVFTQENGIKLFASPDPSKPGGFRVTWFQADGSPSGHAEFDSLQDAVLSAGGFFDSKHQPPVGFRVGPPQIMGQPEVAPPPPPPAEAPDALPDTLEGLIDAYKASGRAAYWHPRLKRVRLDGKQSLPEKEAMVRMAETLARDQGRAVPAPPPPPAAVPPPVAAPPVPPAVQPPTATQTVNVRTAGNRMEANAADLAADYKARGLERTRAWDEFIKDRALKPEINAKDFYAVFDRVAARPLGRVEARDFAATHYDTIRKLDVQAVPTEHGHSFVWADGMTGSDPGPLAERYVPKGEVPATPAPPTATPEPAATSLTARIDALKAKRQELPEAPPDVFLTLDSINRKANRDTSGYDPEVVTPERIAEAKAQGLVSGTKFFKLTREGRAKHSEWARQARERMLSESSLEDEIHDLELEASGYFTGGQPEAQAVTATPAASVEPRKYASTQVDLPPVSAGLVKKAQAFIEPEDLGKGGLEQTPHITVKYGLHDDNPDQLRALLADEPPITATLGKIDAFPDGDDGVPLIVRVESPGLHRLNAKIADALKHTDTHPTYQPHVTLGYLKPGSQGKYVGRQTISGHKITLNAVTFSGKNDEQIVIQLGGTAAPAPPVVAEPSGAKEPWEMTREEFAANQGGDNAYVQQQRDAVVKQAVKSGKPVPPEVLADYPDLKPSGAAVAKAGFETRAQTRRQKTIAAGKAEAAEMTKDLLPMDPAQERREMERLLVEMNTGDFTPTSYTNIGEDSTFDGMQGLASGLSKGQRLIGTGRATRLRVSGSAGAPIYDDILAHMPGASRPTRAGVIAALQAWLDTGKVTNATLGALEVARIRAGLSQPRAGHKMTAPMPWNLAETKPDEASSEYETRDIINPDTSFNVDEFEAPGEIVSVQAGPLIFKRGEQGGEIAIDISKLTPEEFEQYTADNARELQRAEERKNAPPSRPALPDLDVMALPMPEPPPVDTREAWEVPEDELVQWKDTIAKPKNPPPQDDADMSEAAMYARALRYRRDELEPPEVPQHPVGSWGVDSTGELMQLREFDIDDPILRFNEGEKKNATTEKYAEWIKAGHEPPALQGLETEKGSVNIQEGHHRWSALKQAGRDKVKVWVSITRNVDIGKGLTMPRGVKHADLVKEHREAARRDAQPSLPGTEGVRTVENKTPEFELPYALTPNKRGLGPKVETPDMLAEEPKSKPERERDAFNANKLMRWFGKSKIADDDGKPRVVYHGTRDDITRFDLDHPNRKDSGWLGTGVYLTTSPDVAASYSLLKTWVVGPNVMPLYAKVENPYYATQQEKERLMLLSTRDKAAGRRAADAWTRELKAKGHDGVIMRYTKEIVGEKNVSDEIVVFDPAGVKSAIGNAGTFDPNTDDIRRAP